MKHGYLNNWQLFQCPSAQRSDLNTLTSIGVFRYDQGKSTYYDVKIAEQGDYAAGPWWRGGGNDHDAIFYSLRRMRAPGGTLLLSCTRRSFPNGYAGYGNWAFAPTLAITTGGTGLNHNGRANLACVDGHVASHGRAELREIGYTVVVTSADQCIAP